MHTPTEGGVINGLFEMGAAAGVGLSIEENLIPIAPETSIIADTLDVDPLKLLSSGSLLIAADETKAEKIIQALEAINIPSAVIGSVKERSEGRVLTRTDGSQKTIDPVKQDELFRILGEG